MLPIGCGISVTIPKARARINCRRMRAMIHSVKDLSPDQKLAIESLLGRPISEGEQVSVRTVPASPERIVSIQEDSRKKGTDRLTMEEIDAEIGAARRERGPRSGQ